ncbi:MAG: metallophosphoesterase [Myxococcales bacterium]|nr:metallophosphoesterase [Myxococcales bacterium]
MRLLRSSYADRPPRSPTGWGPVRAGGGKTTWIGLVACACTLLAMACANPVAKPAHPEGGAASGQTAAPLVLSVVGTNDLHGHLETLPVLSGYVANLRTRRAEAGGAVLLLDAGDMFQGTLASNLAEGQPVIEAYNHLGYAAVAIGNHEFDFGPEGPAALSTSPTENARGALFARARQARFPFLSANVVEEGSGQALDADNVFPSRLLRIGAVNVGVVGVTTEATPRSTLARNFAGLRVTALADAIIAEAQALREAAAEVVIVLAHAGAACQHLDDPKAIDSCRPEAEIFDVARALPPGLVDGIVAGHTHAGVAHEINGIPIIEAFAYGRAFGRFDLVLNARTRRPERHQIFPPAGSLPASAGHTRGPLCSLCLRRPRGAARRRPRSHRGPRRGGGSTHGSAAPRDHRASTHRARLRPRICFR